MGRSATLCNGKDILDWSAILEHRSRLAANLETYLKDSACVEGAPQSGRGQDEYRDELANAYKVAIQLEANLIESKSAIYGTSVSFAVIYAELWHLAVNLSIELPRTTDHELRRKSSQASGQISLLELREFNQGLRQLQASDSKMHELRQLASLLADAYLKAYMECDFAIKSRGAKEIRHHILVIGDILQEMLDLHATLLPAKPVTPSDNAPYEADAD